jgi:2-oxoglutarate dehydrogenase E1 component
MAHRGRLNVLTQVMAKPHRALFHEFKGGSYAPDDVEGSGDVKYHLGASSDREFDGNKVHLSLTANPSHLEIVDPVVLGKARAKQDQLFGRARGEIVPQEERAKVLPLLLHGDAAFAGQGVIAECLGLSGLRGHRWRHAPLHHQQPDRLHDEPALLALVALSVRRCQDDRGADLPREWR